MKRYSTRYTARFRKIVVNTLLTTQKRHREPSDAFCVNVMISKKYFERILKKYSSIVNSKRKPKNQKNNISLISILRGHMDALDVRGIVFTVE